MSKFSDGFKWVFLLSTLAIPIQFLVSVVIGRYSPEALGIYASVELILSLIVVFIFIGGEYTFIKFIPIFESKKASIIFYLLSVLLLSVFYIFVTLLFSNGWEYFEERFEKNNLEMLFNQKTYFLGYLYLLWSISIAYLKGINSLKYATISQKVPIIIPLIYFLVSVKLKFNLSVMDHVIVSFYLMIIFGLILSLFFIYKSKSQNKMIVAVKDKYNLYNPKRIFKYSFYLYLSGIIIFSYEKLDQFIIMTNFNIEVLGIYFACYKISLLAKFIPKTMNQSLLPTFSKMISTDDKSSIEKYHNKNIKFNVIFSALISGFVVIFSGNILSLYGIEYSEYSWLLSGLICLFFLGAPGQVNSNLIGIIGNGKKMMTISGLVVVVQIIVMFSTVSYIGLWAILFARLCAVILNQILTNYELKKIYKVNRNSISYYLIGTLLIMLSFINYTSVIIQIIYLFIYTTIFIVFYYSELNILLKKIKVEVLQR